MSLTQTELERLADYCGWRQRSLSYRDEIGTIMYSYMRRQSLTKAGAFDVLEKMGWCADPCWSNDQKYWQIETLRGEVLSDENNLLSAVQKAVIEWSKQQ